MVASGLPRKKFLLLSANKIIIWLKTKSWPSKTDETQYESMLPAQSTHLELSNSIYHNSDSDFVCWGFKLTSQCLLLCLILCLDLELDINWYAYRVWVDRPRLDKPWPDSPPFALLGIAYGNQVCNIMVAAFLFSFSFFFGKDGLLVRSDNANQSWPCVCKGANTT